MFVKKITRLEVCLRLNLILVLVVLAVETRAQTPAAANAGIQEKVAALKESVAQNQAALKTYKWTEATEISLKGEVKKKEQKLCQYGPDGKVQKTPVAGGAPAPKEEKDSGGGGRRGGGVVKKAVVENKVEDMKEYMEKAAALVQEYVPPDPQKIQAAAAAGKISTQPASGQGISTLTIKDYAKMGDKLILGFDPVAKKLRSYQVQSYVEKPKDDAVNLTVTFASLPDGTNYPQQTVLDVAAKKINVKTVNSGYAKVTP
jgi:hypothetical protein